MKKNADFQESISQAQSIATPLPIPKFLTATLIIFYFISNAVLERPVNNSQNFDSVAYIAQEIQHFCCLALRF